MLAIRMQRTGRTKHAMFRMIVQDSRLRPTSGRVVARLGHYDPHAKVLTLDKEKAQTYLDNGAQPSERVVRIFQGEGVKLPKWVSEPRQSKGTIKNPDKLRKNRPAEAAENKPAEIEAETPADQPAEPVAEAEAKPESDGKDESETPEQKQDQSKKD